MQKFKLLQSQALLEKLAKQDEYDKQKQVTQDLKLDYYSWGMPVKNMAAANSEKDSDNKVLESAKGKGKKATRKIKKTMTVVTEV